ncbi:MAG: hypothetical protein GYB68_07900 [Chloroflexi bacterium]|nr:hypothetical protein [Chloroflexota bacterium]
MYDIHPPPYELLTGTILTLDGFPGLVAVTGDLDEEFQDEHGIYKGEIVFYYAINMLYQPHSVIPQFTLDDKKREYHGFDAVHFMIEKGDSYPRADVIGARADNGEFVELFLKQLDLAKGVEVYAYRRPNFTSMIGEVVAVVKLQDGLAEPYVALSPEASHDLPPTLARYTRMCAMRPDGVAKLTKHLQQLMADSNSA